MSESLLKQVAVAAAASVIAWYVIRALNKGGCDCGR